MHAHTHTTRGILSRDLRLQRRWFATRRSSDGGVRLAEAAIQKVSSGHNLGYYIESADGVRFERTGRSSLMVRRRFTSGGGSGS
ncbi:hypothetical protein OROGR_004746 [Orobanche gracilis]